MSVVRGLEQSCTGDKDLAIETNCTHADPNTNFYQEICRQKYTIYQDNWSSWANLSSTHIGLSWGLRSVWSKFCKVQKISSHEVYIV